MQYADSDSLVRAFGHPSFLKIAEAVNGEDFVPFTETMWYKAPYATSTACTSPLPRALRPPCR